MDDLWCHGIVECLTCGHKWIGVWPLGADELECPKCEGTDTVREAADNQTARLF